MIGAPDIRVSHNFYKHALVFALTLGYQNIQASQESVLGNENLKSVDDFKASSLGVDRDAMPGAILFRDNCLGCHNGSVSRAPHKQWLELMDAHTLNASLAEGLMKTQASHLTSIERNQKHANKHYAHHTLRHDNKKPQQ